MVVTLPPRLDPEPWPQPGDGHNTPIYPRRLTMTLLYEAQQKDLFIRHLIQTYVKVLREEWPPRPLAGECTPEAVAFYKAPPHLSVTSSQDPSMTADILAYKKKFVAPPALREDHCPRSRPRPHRDQSHCHECVQSKKSADIAKAIHEIMATDFL